MPASLRALALVLLLLPAHATAEEVITLINGEWLPYMSEKLPDYGPISHIVSAAFALEGVTVRYVFRPWSRAYAEADSSAANGSIVWSVARTENDRLRRFYFSDTVFEGQSVFFHLKNYPFEWTGFEQLRDIKMGGTAGYVYWFDRFPYIKIDRTAATDELNFRKLLAGRFQIFPANLDVGLHIMRNDLTPEQAAQITWDPKPYNITPYHLMLNKKDRANQRYLALFNRGLQRLRDSGRYAQYMREVRGNEKSPQRP